MEQVKQAAIKALIYADIFNYPLTLKQLWEYAISSQAFSFQQLSVAIPALRKEIFHKGDYYFLLRRDLLVDLRSARVEPSKHKLERVQVVSRFLSIIPTICFIGVSGSVTMGNADKDDDIDIFIITFPGCVWISRLLVAISLGVLGIRRKKYAKKVADTVCANMFVSKDAIEFPTTQRNLYTAHEIAQTIPLFSVDNTYDEFISTNQWIYSFLPNWKKKNIRSVRQAPYQKFFAWILTCLEPLVRLLQVWYMGGSRTTETVSKNVIAFYPSDRYKTVMTKFIKGCKTYDL